MRFLVDTATPDVDFARLERQWSDVDREWHVERTTSLRLWWPTDAEFSFNPKGLLAGRRLDHHRLLVSIDESEQKGVFRVGLIPVDLNDRRERRRRRGRACLVPQSRRRLGQRIISRFLVHFGTLGKGLSSPNPAPCAARPIPRASGPALG